MLVVVATMSARGQCAFGLTGLSRVATGPATTTMARDSGTRMTTDQVSSAEVIWPTRAFSAGSAAARSAERARTGTMALVSAPPRTSSYIRFGTWLAVTYAVPRQVAPMVWENTRVRTSPRIRDTMVSPAISIAPRAMPVPDRAGSATPVGCATLEPHHSDRSAHHHLVMRSSG